LPINLIRSRPIVHEGPNFYLFSADVESTPGHLTLEPRDGGNREAWIKRIMEFLDTHSNPYGVQTGANIDHVPFILANNTRYSSMYRDGTVIISPQLLRVEIAESHHNLLDVARELANYSGFDRSPKKPLVRRQALLWVN